MRPCRGGSEPVLTVAKEPARSSEARQSSSCVGRAPSPASLVGDPESCARNKTGSSSKPQRLKSANSCLITGTTKSRALPETNSCEVSNSEEQKCRAVLGLGAFLRYSQDRLRPAPTQSLLPYTSFIRAAACLFPDAGSRARRTLREDRASPLRWSCENLHSGASGFPALRLRSGCPDRR